MRILLYSDVHISRTSSILPTTYYNTNYTYRQGMLIKTAQWLSKLARDNKPDLIINLGDTFDQHTLTSYDIETARKFFSEFTDVNIPHIVLVGNHEMINTDYNAVALLNNINNITVVDKPWSVDYNVNGNITKLAFLPYRHTKDILDFPKGDFLFSHNDIYGSKIRGDIRLETGIQPNILQQQYKLVFNGHIHKSSIEGNVVNVGSCTTHSFADDNDWQPHAYIFNTETMNLETFNNLSCPLFKNYNIETLDGLNNMLDSLDKRYSYILHITCPFEIKDSVKAILVANRTIKTDTENEIDYILNFKLNVKVTNNTKHKLEETTQINKDIHTNLDIKKSFMEFLNITDLKYPKQLYLDILQD